MRTAHLILLLTIPTMTHEFAAREYAYLLGTSQTCFRGILIYTNCDLYLPPVVTPTPPSVGRWKSGDGCPSSEVLSPTKDPCGVQCESPTEVRVTRLFACVEQSGVR